MRLDINVTSEDEEPEVMVKATFPNGDRLANGDPWFHFIHEVNRLEDGTFGAPCYLGVKPGADHYVEEYPDANVEIRGSDNHHRDQVVTIVSKTPEGARLIREAAGNLGLTVKEV